MHMLSVMLVSIVCPTESTFPLMTLMTPHVSLGGVAEDSHYSHRFCIIHWYYLFPSVKNKHNSSWLPVFA